MLVAEVSLQDSVCIDKSFRSRCCSWRLIAQPPPSPKIFSALLITRIGS
jgi:hypothetical protein